MLQFCHEAPEVRGLLQLGIAGEQRGRGLARLDDGVLVAEDSQLLERAAEAGLRTTQDVALTPLLEVDPAQLEAVGGGGHGVEPFARRTVRVRAGDEEAQARQTTPADPSAQLV